MRRLTFLAALVLAWAPHATAEKLGLPAERVLELVKDLAAFRESAIRAHDDPKATALVIASAPKSDPDVTIELHGDRTDLAAIVVTVKAKRADAGAAAALGRLIAAVMPQFPPAPAAYARTTDGREIDVDLRWPAQFETETRRRSAFFGTSLMVRRAGGRAMVVGWNDGDERTEVTFVAGTGAAIPDWADAPPPRGAEFAQALAAMAEGRYDAVLETLKARAALRHVEAQAWLADSLLSGRGIPPASLDSDETRREILSLADAADEMGETHGAYLLGRLSRLDDRNPRHLTDSIGWYRRAAAMGHPGAMNALALALPRETAEQQEEIADWDEFAARLGNWSAMVGISGSYRVGEGRAKDSKLAYFWARVFETRYPVLPGANPATQRVLSARIGSELDEATKVEIEAEVVQWKPVGFAELKGHCGRIRCPKTLRR